MASTTNQLKKFFVYAPDSLKEGTLELRYQVRETHLEVIKPLIDSGIVRTFFFLYLETRNPRPCSYRGWWDVYRPRHPD